MVKRLPDWFWLLVIATILRLYNLGYEQLWFDEAFTALVANPHTDFWLAVTGDNHPPLWSVIQAVNYRILGDSEFAFRLPSALMSIASVLLIWRIALALNFQQKTAFIAGLLAATLPAGLYFAQDGRMYAALIFFVLLALDSALRENWLLFFIGCAGAVYTQNVGVLYTFALGSVILLSRLKEPRTLIRPFIALVGVVLVWSPWALFAYKQAAAMKGNHWLPPMNFEQFFVPWPIATMGWRVPESIRLHVYVVAIVLTLLSLYVTRSWLRTRNGMILASVVFVAPVAVAVVSTLYQNVYLYRALMPSFIALMVMWAYPLTHISPANRRVAWLVVTPAFLIGIYSHYNAGEFAREPMIPYADVMRSNWQAGDIVYHTSPTSLVTIGHYSPDLPHVVWPAPGDFTTVTDQCKLAFKLHEVDISRLKEQGYKRAWFIYVESPLNRWDEIKEYNLIMETYHPQLMRSFRENPVIETRLYLLEL